MLIWKKKKIRQMQKQIEAIAFSRIAHKQTHRISEPQIKYEKNHSYFNQNEIESVEALCKTRWVSFLSLFSLKRRSKFWKREEQSLNDDRKLLNQLRINNIIEKYKSNLCIFSKL